MDLENTFIVASIGEQAENDGLVKKAGEEPLNPPLPPGLEETMLRGLLCLDTEEPITDEHREIYRLFYEHTQFGQ